MAQRNPSKITTEYAVDDPLVQDASFEFDADDRQYIDNQIRGTQARVVALNDAFGGGDITDEVITWSPTASPNGEAQSIHKTFDTPGATESTAMTIALPDESFADLTATVLGRSEDDQHFAIDLRASWSRTAAGAPVEQRAPGTAAPGDTNPGAWAAVFDVNGNNARVRVTGEAALAIRWSIVAEAQIVTLEATAGGGTDPVALFGADLVGYLNENYDDSTGVWVDESASAVPTSQATSGKRPTETTINGHVAALFDGTDDALNWGGDREVLTGDFIIFGVIQTSVSESNSFLLSKLYGGSAWYLGITFFGNAGKYAAGANSDGGTGFAEADSDLADGNPHVVVGVRSGTTVTLYVDGVLQADTGTDASAPITNTADFVCVGAAMFSEAGAVSGPYDGKLGQVGMVNRAPAGGELASLNDFLMTWAGI